MSFVGTDLRVKCQGCSISPRQIELLDDHIHCSALGNASKSLYH